MHTHAADWLRLVQAEYDEMPGLNLTKPQVRRLFDLDQATCDEVLGTLEAEQFLMRTEGDRYVRVGDRRKNPWSKGKSPQLCRQ